MGDWWSCDHDYTDMDEYCSVCIRKLHARCKRLEGALRSCRHYAAEIADNPTDPLRDVARAAVDRADAALEGEGG